MIDKAIYSFWSKPMDNTYVGFNSEKSLIECFSISVMMSRKHFSKVELITDIKGKELLIDKYKLPFTSVSTELEEALKDINKRHWSIGKIYACKIQKEPFIHIDNDAIWFKKPPIELLTADACFQNEEGIGYEHSYEYLRKHAIDNYKDYPKYIRFDESMAYNCGIMGFNKFDCLETWWKDALDYIKFTDSYFKDIYAIWHEDNPDHTLLPLLIFEQLFIVGICKEFNYNVKFIKVDGVDDETSKLLGYTHLIANTKRSEYVKQLLSANYEILFNEELSQIEN